MILIDLVFLPGKYKASASISFDFETSAQSPPITFKSKIKTAFLSIGNTLGIIQHDMAGRYGRGYANRRGAEKILELFRELNIHGTWFSTGHVLLKGNRTRWEYQTNRLLPYASLEAGFTDATTWRQSKRTFCHEPFSDHKHHPNYYLGDLTEAMLLSGEDIQCHSFSHPYMAMESPENIRRDLEDWGKAATLNGFAIATIFAFPFLGDVYNISGKEKYIPYKAPEQSIRTRLTAAQLEVFKSFGFQLFTRCLTSENITLFNGFKPYCGTDIYFMKDKGLLGFANSTEFDEYLQMVLAERATIDFWLHPNDIYDEKTFKIFKERVINLYQRYLAGEIWIATIREQWERFKQMKQIKFDVILKDNNSAILNVRNNSDKPLVQVTFDCHATVTASQQGINTDGQLLIIDRIEPGGNYDIELTLQ
jgi:hypothetical protein